MSSLKFAVDGMHCQSCELLIERKLKNLPGVQSVDVNAAKGVARVNCQAGPPSLDAIQQAIGDDGYAIRPWTGNAGTASVEKRPTFWELLKLFSLVLALGRLVSKLGWLKAGAAFGDGATFWTVFAVGLVAAASSCIAVTGGLLLSAAAKYNARYGSNLSPARKFRPVLMFTAGRVVSYGLLGGAIGFLGKSLAPSPFATGAITVLAALYMLTMGLDMLGIAPTWLKGLMPRMPKAISRRVMDAEGRPHPLAPALLGAATFFIPCGFTQALQLYALTTGSAVRSATLLFAFALGTAPALLALGWASSAFKGKTGASLLRFSGALVVILGLWNIQNGLTITGHPLSWPSFTQPSAASAASASDPNVTMDGGTQVVKMGVGRGGYEPSQFTIKTGAPVRWEIDGTHATGCVSVIQAPQLGIRKLLEPGTNTIAFDAPAPGDYLYSCAMGMYRGMMHVIPNS